jgi:hypothetical protein
VSPSTVQLDGFVNKHSISFWAPENPYRVVDTSFCAADCTVWCAVDKNILTGPIFIDRTIKIQCYLHFLECWTVWVFQKKGIRTFSQQVGACLLTTDVLDVLYYVYF